MNIDKKLNVILTANEKKADGILAVIALKGPKCYDDLYRSRPKSLGSRRIVKERENLGSQSAVHLALMHLKKCKLLRVYKKCLISQRTRYSTTLRCPV